MIVSTLAPGLDEKERPGAAVSDSARSCIALGERQSAAVMQLRTHTCFETALAAHREPAMPT
jgi:hypothetical protein